MGEEAKLERKLRLWIKNLGGLCLKWTSPGYTGVPDRIILLNGKVWFVELKARHGNPSKRQAFVHREFDDKGIKVWVCYNWEQLKILIDDILAA